MSEFTDIMDRLVAIEKEAYTGSDAVDHGIHWQEAFPYWINLLGPATYGWDSENIVIVTRDVQIRLIVAHLTEGYDGDAEEKLFANLDEILLFFLTHEDLTSTAYPTAPVYLYSTETELRADTGLTIWRLADNAPSQIGIEFTLTIAYRVDIP